MKIEIRVITNGYLVTAAAGPSADDPLGDCGGFPETFADTREAVCGLIAEQVLKMPEPGRTA